MRVAIIGDMHTVTAFRVAGVKGFPADAATAGDTLRRLFEDGNYCILAVTRGLAETLDPELVHRIRHSTTAIFMEVPALDDEEGFRGGIMQVLTEALGIEMQER